MGRRSTLSLLGLRDGSSFSGCESGEDVFVCVSRSLFVLSLALSLSLFGCLESGNHLKVKEKHK